jgi:hypothetical protein
MMNRCEAEIDSIRAKLYEETKHLTREEQNKRLRDRGQKLAAQFGFTIIPSASRVSAKSNGG